MMLDSSQNYISIISKVLYTIQYIVSYLVTTYCTFISEPDVGKQDTVAKIEFIEPIQLSRTRLTIVNERFEDFPEQGR
jgi:hypothetical protein